MFHKTEYGSIGLALYNKSTPQEQFALDDNISLYDMILDLQDAKIGDPRRLAYIMERIDNGRPIYNSDERYVREKFRQLREDLTHEAEETPSVHQHETTPPEPQPKPTVIYKDDRSPSKTWYTMPVFLGILGGLIAFVALRRRNRGMAYKNLGVGVGITMILTVLVLGSMIVEDEDITSMFYSESPQHVTNEVEKQAETTPDIKPATEKTRPSENAPTIEPTIDDVKKQAETTPDIKPATEKTRPSENAPTIEPTIDDVKKQAIHIPYKSLMEQSDVHVGEIVWYEGEMVQVVKNPYKDEYIVRTEIAKHGLFKSDVVWVNYKATSDKERAWLDRLESESLDFEKENDWVKIWGTFKGLKEYEGAALKNKIILPEVDAIFMERLDVLGTANSTHVDPEPQIAASTLPSTSHTISFSDIPAYVDELVVERAIIDAVREWDMANSNVDFTIVESDADVNINWARYMPGSTLGLHSASVTDDGTRERHSITVRIGIDDCHSNYQQFGHGMYQYTIAHELGHYLGLRHVDNKNHLMYSGDFFNVDEVQVYDDLGLNIPHLKIPEIATVAGLEIQFQIDDLNEELDRVSMQRQDLKNSGNSLDANTARYNELVSQIQELKDMLTCVNLT